MGAPPKMSLSPPHLIHQPIPISPYLMLKSLSIYNTKICPQGGVGPQPPPPPQPPPKASETPPSPPKIQWTFRRQRPPTRGSQCNWGRGVRVVTAHCVWGGVTVCDRLRLAPGFGVKWGWRWGSTGWLRSDPQPPPHHHHNQFYGVGRGAKGGPSFLTLKCQERGTVLRNGPTLK